MPALLAAGNYRRQAAPLQKNVRPGSPM